MGVHPDLVRVVKEAINRTTRDFMVVEGVRTVEQAYRNFGKGRTAAECQAAGCPTQYARPSLAKVTWVRHPLSSKHLPVAGWGHAVDLAPWPYDPNDEDRKGYAAIAFAMQSAAADFHVPIEWGGTWSTPDKPHFQLKVNP